MLQALLRGSRAAMWLFHCSLIVSETCYLDAFNSLGLPVPLGLWRQTESCPPSTSMAPLSLSPLHVCLIPNLNSLLCNSRDFLVVDIIVCSSDSVCRSLSNKACFGAAYVKKNPDLPISLTDYSNRGGLEPLLQSRGGLLHVPVPQWGGENLGEEGQKPP